jgi:glutamate/tyrosine decarboxylase-like PLP-dependent enzyme
VTKKAANHAAVQLRDTIPEFDFALPGVTSMSCDTVRGGVLPGRLSAISVFRSKSFLYGGFVWARRALNSKNAGFRPGQHKYGYATKGTSVVLYRSKVCCAPGG